MTDLPEDDERNLFLRVSQTVVTTPFQQCRLLNEPNFESFLEKRDIGLGRAITLLRQGGFIAPVLVQRELTARERRSNRFIEISGTKDDPAYAELPHVRVVRRRDRSWVRSRDRRAQYHPFQVWLILRLEEYVRPAIHVMVPLLSKDEYIRRATGHAGEVWRGIREYRKSDEYFSFLKLLSLLIAIDPLVIPAIRSRVSTQSGTLGDHRAWVRQQRGLPVLRRSGLRLSELREWYEKIASHASQIDPNERWFDLIRNSSFDARLRLKGQALLAQTLYEMAEMIRRFAEDWLGKDWEEENDVRQGPYGDVVKRNLYGGARIADGDPKVKMNVLRDFGLDPQPRVHLFVEGPTEAGFLRRYVEKGLGIELRRAGIEIIELEGVQGVRRQRQYLERLRAEGQL